VILDDHEAAALARVMFAYRALPGAIDTPLDIDLRRMVATWTAAPNRPIDAALYRRVGRRLQGRARSHPAEAERLRVLAAVILAFASGDADRVLVARYSAGESSQQLALQIGLSDTAVLQRLRQAGATTGPLRTPEWKRARAVELYLAGSSARQVAAEVGTAKPMVLRWVREAGHQPRPSSRPKSASTAAG
jgi:hypothetical protein